MKRLLFLALPLVLAGCSLSPISAPKGYEVFEIETVDQIKLHAYWKAPLGEHRPAVIFFSGADGVKFVNQPYQNYFEGQDWGFLVIDSYRPRGSVKFSPAMKSMWPEKRKYDVAAAVKWVKSQKQIDSGRIALFGLSHGARAILSALEDSWPEKPQVNCAALVSPGCEAYVGQKARANERIYRDYKNSTPLMMLCGELDTFTPASYCEKLAAKLTKEGTSVRFEVVENGGHMPFQKPQRKGPLVSPYTNEAVTFGSDPRTATFSQLKLYDFLYQQLKDQPKF